MQVQTQKPIEPNKNRIKISCKNCEKKFEDKYYPYRTSKFCSQKCYGLSKVGKPPWNKGTKGMMSMPWNKGLTKKNSEKMRCTAKKQSKIRKDKLKNGEIVTWNRNKKIDKEKYPNFGMKDKKHSRKTIKKMSEKAKLRIGEKSSNWQGGISFEPYGPEFNNKFKRAIRKRDNQICMLCGVHSEKLNRALDVHHINYDKLMSIPQNCVSLCRRCNLKLNTNRRHWTKFFQSLLTKEYNYQYSENQEVILEVKNEI